MATPTKEEFLTFAELANALDVSYHSVYRAFSSGKKSLATDKLCFLKARQRFGRFYTKMSWYLKFESELNGDE